MRLHDRYLFRELLTPLAYCLGGFMALWVSFFFFTKLDDMREAKLHGFEVVEYCVAGLPEFFILVLPVLLLLALLYALTHHARHNELTALRAAGISLHRLCLPYYITGILAVGIYFALNEMAVPACQRWTTEILSRHTRSENDLKHPTRFIGTDFYNARAHRKWRLGIYDTKTAMMTKPWAMWPLPGGGLRQFQAESGVFTKGAWTFTGVALNEVRAGEKNFVPLIAFDPTNRVTLPEFDERPDQIALGIKFSEAGGLLSSRSASIPLVDLWPYLRDHPELARRDATNWWTKFHARIAAPWTCLIVVLMAIPFGAPSGRRNLFFGVAGSIFICFGYFVLQSVCLALGMSGRVEPWLAAWLPNCVFAATGLVLMLRVR
jgi:lipopolysaccharide export system permease protein